MEPGRTRYAKNGDIHIAYQVFGEGDVDLVFVPGFLSHIEYYWDEPNLARWLRRLGSFSRVIMFDKRGTGLSDRVSELLGLDARMDDVRAVMDATGVVSHAGSARPPGRPKIPFVLLHPVQPPGLGSARARELIWVSGSKPKSPNHECTGS